MNTTEVKKLKIALAGYANVGKSVIFNQLTGLHQHIGNWPGKTVEKAEGTLHYNGYSIDILDLPGICSLSSYSIEETITRDYITLESPDFILSIIDTTNLETNLILTLQLLELERPTVLALNMIDIAIKKGAIIDQEKIAKALDIPVVTVTATKGMGITDMLDHGLSLITNNPTARNTPKYGKEVEERVEQLIELLTDQDLPYPKRFVAIKLLEKDAKICELMTQKNITILNHALKLIAELETIHGHDSSIIIADERSILASRIAKSSLKFNCQKKNRNYDDWCGDINKFF